jgi:hypothetical protein
VVGDAGGPGGPAAGLSADPRAAYDAASLAAARRAELRYAAEAAVTGTGPLAVDMLVLLAR